MLRLVMTCALEEANYVVTAAEDGARAWNELLTRTFSLLFASIGMPHLDGIRLLERARLAGITAPAILVSNVGDPFTVFERERLGITAILKDTCGSQDILAAASQAFRYGGPAE